MMENGRMIEVLSEDLRLVIEKLEAKRSLFGKIDSARLCLEEVKHIAHVAKASRRTFAREDQVEKAKLFFRLVQERQERRR